MYIRVVTVDVDSKLAVGQQGLQGRKDSLYRKPAAALGTEHWFSIAIRGGEMQFTRGEKLISLIIRFLLHRSS